VSSYEFVRGHRSSYDAWAADGAAGWGDDALLPYFRRSETTLGSTSAIVAATSFLLSEEGGAHPA
jgi:choline dehydrogenase